MKYTDSAFLQYLEIKGRLTPLLIASMNNDTEIVKLLLDYANASNNIIPLLVAIINKNIEIVKLLIDYSNKNNIVLELNEQDYKGLYPLLFATKIKNTEMHNNYDKYPLLVVYIKIKTFSFNLRESVGVRKLLDRFHCNYQLGSCINFIHFKAFRVNLLKMTQMSVIEIKNVIQQKYPEAIIRNKSLNI
ncbi:hypothetical protein H8356DRAFT_1353928 [Neocallimastix lanati (nom. inval.)]|nr:hypothetical protein H8356DRAFT_1353928 [Neocallimastix sp. JGI-2020a]